MNKYINNNIFQDLINRNDYKKKYLNKYFLEDNDFERHHHLEITNIIILLLILFFLSEYNTQEIEIRHLIFSYEITIIIEGNGEQKILSDGFNILPSQIFINFLRFVRGLRGAGN